MHAVSPDVKSEASVTVGVGERSPQRWAVGTRCQPPARPCRGTRGELPVPDQQTIVNSISSILAEQLSLSLAPGALDPDTPLFGEGLGLDSFGIVELISELERRLGVEFQEEDFSETHFRTVGTLAKLVIHYLQQASPS